MMFVRSQTNLTRREHGWLEYTEVAFAPEVPDEPDEDLTRLAFRELEFSPPLGPVVIARRNIVGTMRELPNAWNTARVAPQIPSKVVLPSTATISDEQFWAILGGSISSSMRDIPWDLRSALSLLTQKDVVGFQRKLVAIASSLVDRLGCSWASAGATLLGGRTTTEEILSGARPVPRADTAEFEDLTDIAEEVIGARIEIPGFGSSRSARRDPQPVLPVAIQSQLDGRAEFSLGVAEWEELPWRWTSWRIRGIVDGSSNESIVLANRAWGTSIGAATKSAVNLLESRGETVVGEVEILDPEIRRPHVGWPPVHYFYLKDSPDRDEYMRLRGYC